ncbi:MAG: NUDIX domain-containing protein [Clostridia bacterium]|nr:NUDIX domain-containing protein [Clostridia bacterium]
MYCTVCGEKLTLMFKQDEGLVPYCKNCAEYRFPRFATAVSMVVTNRTKDKILLAKHNGSDDYILFAGYIKKGETAEKAVTREFKEETRLDTVKYKYMGSRYHEPKELLMLNYVLIAENGTPVPDPNELDEVEWFEPDSALQAIRKDSLAEAFLKNALKEIKKL